MNLGWKIQNYEAHLFIKDCLNYYNKKYKNSIVKALKNI